MRKQYHFRPGEVELRAWDVDRLVRLSGHVKSELVPVATSREMDDAYWGQPMTCRDVAEHARLIDEASLELPVILSSDARIMDGMHRVLKALMKGRSHIEAVRFEVDPEPDHVGVLNPDDLPHEADPIGKAVERDASQRHAADGAGRRR